MDISDVAVCLNKFEILGRRKKIILALYPEKTLQQNEISQLTKILETNLSNYINELEKAEIVQVTRNRNKENRKVKNVKLSHHFHNILQNTWEIIKPKEKIPLTDIEGFKKIQKLLLEKESYEKASDGIQLISRKFKIPNDTEFFCFLKKNWENTYIQKKLRILITSANSMVEDMPQVTKEKIIETMTKKLQKIFTDDKYENSENATISLLSNLGIEFTYEELKKQYLTHLQKEKDPGLFRTIIKRDYPENFIDIWMALMDHKKSAPENQKAIYDNEFSLFQ